MKMNENCIEKLIQTEQLPASYRLIIDAYWRPLAEDIAELSREKSRPVVIGVNGGQGSGKTTLCKFLESCLLPACGLAAVTVSLDDFYLPKTVRTEMAENIYPLFATRGVPGTHDVEALQQTISALKAGEGVIMPVFNKARDDRAPEAEWRRVKSGQDVILFEGWCVGAVAQERQALETPVNMLERDEDAEGVWRRHVNERLGSDYDTLFGLIDRLIMLRAPSMETILANRRKQEQKLRDRAPGGDEIMSDSEVARFVQFYERLTRHMLDEMPARADIVFDLEALRRVQGA